MRSVLMELRRVGPFQTDDIAAELDHRALHAEANAEERNLPFPGEANRLDLAFDATLAEASWHEQSVITGEQAFWPFSLDQLALNSLDADLRIVGDACMIERFIDGFIGVAVFRILAHHGDADFSLWVAQPMDQPSPIVQH